MAIKKILTVPNEILETPCEKVSIFDDEVKQIATDITETLLAATNPEGAGLAAPQIGILKKIIVVRRFIPDPQDAGESISKEYVLVNPKIISQSEETETRYEACLSIPNMFGEVERPKKIKIKAFDVEGNPIRMSESGFFARIVQHEIDHLNGILFTTKAVGELLTNEQLEALYSEDDK
jgi:peptide deformylase